MPASVTTNASGSIQGTCRTTFQRVEVFCGSDYLETINNSDQIDSYFVDCQLNPIDRVYGWSTTIGTCAPATLLMHPKFI